MAAWDRQDEQPPGERGWFPLAPITDLPTGPRLFYIGWYLRDAQRHADAPRLTDAQLDAMALLESIANDPSFHLEMTFERGDVQLLNNGRVLHAREAYEDDDRPGGAPPPAAAVAGGARLRQPGARAARRHQHAGALSTVRPGRSAPARAGSACGRRATCW